MSTLRDYLVQKRDAIQAIRSNRTGDPEPMRIGRLTNIPVVRDRAEMPEVPPFVEKGDNSRKDAGKDSGFWLIPTGPLTELAKLYALGAAKYSPRGWERGMKWSRIVDPMFRHPSPAP